jgi:hypothetical protein
MEISRVSLAALFPSERFIARQLDEISGDEARGDSQSTAYLYK